MLLESIFIQDEKKDVDDNFGDLWLWVITLSNSWLAFFHSGSQNAPNYGRWGRLHVAQDKGGS